MPVDTLDQTASAVRGSRPGVRAGRDGDDAIDPLLLRVLVETCDCPRLSSGTPTLFYHDVSPAAVLCFLRQFPSSLTGRASVRDLVMLIEVSATMRPRQASEFFFTKKNR
jgi:hypothetical protein